MHIMTILILTMFLDINCLPSYHWLMHPILSRDSHSKVVIHDSLQSREICEIVEIVKSILPMLKSRWRQLVTWFVLNNFFNSLLPNGRPHQHNLKPNLGIFQIKLCGYYYETIIAFNAVKMLPEYSRLYTVENMSLTQQ